MLCVDQKTQCQALDRTPPPPPTKPGRAGTMTPDYRRNGTIDPLAALNVATGEVLSNLREGHAGTEVLRFFKQIGAALPRDLDVHVVLGNLSAHFTSQIREWLAHKNRRRWHLPFHADPELPAELDRALVQGTRRHATATLNLHECRRTQRRHHHMGRALEPRSRTVHLKATADDMIAKVKRGRETLHQIKSQTEH